jgi:hypothetical protein
VPHIRSTVGPIGCGGNRDFFCKFDVNNRLPILVISGVMSITGRGKTPLAIPEQEIKATKGIGIKLRLSKVQRQRPAIRCSADAQLRP